jgi:hypothetical protein
VFLRIGAVVITAVDWVGNTTVLSFWPVHAVRVAGVRGVVVAYKDLDR